MGLGLPEVIFILLIALLIFGPKRLPEISRTLGKGMAEFRKATNDLKNTISTELTIEDAQQARPRRVDLASVTPVFTSPASWPRPAETVPQEAPADQVVPPAAPPAPPESMAPAESVAPIEPS